METLSLNDLKEKESAFIVNINGPISLKRRLLELGFTKGTIIKIINVSPLKNSYLLEIHGYLLALRKNAVKNIEVVRAKL